MRIGRGLYNHPLRAASKAVQSMPASMVQSSAHLSNDFQSCSWSCTARPSSAASSSPASASSLSHRDHNPCPLQGLARHLHVCACPPLRSVKLALLLLAGAFLSTEKNASSVIGGSAWEMHLSAFKCPRTPSAGASALTLAAIWAFLSSESGFPLASSSVRMVLSMRPCTPDEKETPFSSGALPEPVWIARRSAFLLAISSSSWNAA